MREETMTDANIQNPFAPPRAHVEDQFQAPSAMVTATRGSRLLAVIVDASPVFVVAVIGGILAAIMIPGLMAGNFTPQGAAVTVFGSLMLVFGLVCLGWLIWNIVLLYRYGQTVGKKVMGIRVVRMDGSRVSFPRFLFVRWLACAFILGIVSGVLQLLHVPFAGLIGWVDCLLIFGAARRCLHDYIADTQVVTAESSPNATLEGSRGL
jgi:uncharacterized RDD family membrane protein YckC